MTLGWGTARNHILMYKCWEIMVCKHSPLITPQACSSGQEVSSCFHTLLLSGACRCSWPQCLTLLLPSSGETCLVWCLESTRMRHILGPTKIPIQRSINNYKSKQSLTPVLMTGTKFQAWLSTMPSQKPTDLGPLPYSQLLVLGWCSCWMECVLNGNAEAGGVNGRLLGSVFKSDFLLSVVGWL